MFGRRKDGKLIKGLDGITKLTPLLMTSREGATNYYIFSESVKYFDEFIEQKRQEGIVYNYRDIITAILVRLFRLYPRLNRFIAGGRFYQRNWIDVSMVVHKSLRTGEDETAIKARFTGDETLATIKERMDNEIRKAVFENNATDATTQFMGKLPHFALKIVAGCMRLFDRWGLLSDSFMREASPFHTSIFMADLKSVGLDAVHHHLYNFGNCGFFAAIGKEKVVALAEDESGEVRAEKVINIGVSMDERFIDGLYYARVLKGMSKITRDLSCLERAPKDSEILHNKTFERDKGRKKGKK